MTNKEENGKTDARNQFVLLLLMHFL